MRYFVAVAEHLHFGRAAEELATAQPSLSRQIQQLEDELGVKLFERTNRKVELTSAGRAFLADARRTLQSADASVRHARESADGTRGELRLGFIAGAMMVMLPVALREFRRRFPNVDVVPHAMNYPDHHPALRAGTIDIAWTVAEPEPDIATQAVATDSLLAVVPADHPFASRTTIDVADFTDEGLVLMRHADSPRLHEATMRICAAGGFRPKHVYEVFEEVTVLGLVAAGFGVALVPVPWSVIHVPGIAFCELASGMIISEHLSWHRERHSPMIQAFVDTTFDILK